MKRDLLCLAELTPGELSILLALAADLKAELKAGGNEPLLAHKSLAMVFQKPSLRTRVSFEMGMQQLGGHALYIAPAEIDLGHRESVADVARVLSRYVDGIMARVYAHDDVAQLAQWASVPVINGLSDLCHPCQGLTDLLTIQEHLGHLSGVQLVYVGDGNNMLHTLLYAGALTGMHVTYATPVGYDPLPEVVARAQALATRTNSVITSERDPRLAVARADVIYTDTWTSMGQEDEAAQRRVIFPSYQINASLLAIAGKKVGVMHCLPAHRGEEITDEVADGEQSWLFDQAENRLHAQKAVLVRLLRG